MAVTTEPSADRRAAMPGGAEERLTAADAAHLCPYLVSSDGAWRSLRPAREHRCGALSPATVVASDKQRALCLRAEHSSCATYRAAHNRALGSRGAEPSTDRLWPVARSLPVLLEPERQRLGALPGIRGRSAIQLLLGVLMVVAFMAVVVARTSSGPAPSSPAPSSLVPSISATPSPTPATSPSPTPVPTPPPVPSQATYTVRTGDTLLKVGRRYGVTVAALRVANDLSGTAAVRPGQVLIIPPKASP